MGGCGPFKAPLHCSRLPRALPTGSALHILPPPPPGSLGPSWGGGLGRILHIGPSTPPTSPCCQGAPSLSCLAFSTHLSSPLRRHLRHMMMPMSRVAVPRPPRIPRTRPSVPSPEPPTDPVGKWGGLRAQPPPLTTPSLLTLQSRWGLSAPLMLSNPSPAAGPSSPVSGRQSQSKSERKAAVRERAI